MHVSSMYPPVTPLGDVNVHHVIFRRPDQAKWPDYTVYIDAATGRRQTFREFLERVYDGATFLGTPVSEGGLGIKADDGEIIGILSDNCTDFAILAHSLLAMTIPFSLLSSYTTPFELDHALRTSDVTRLFVHPRLISLALTVAREVGIPECNIYTLAGRVEGRQSFADMIDHVRKSRIPRLDVRPAKEDTLAYLIFSSGTGGLPKAVMISHGNLVFSLLQMAVIGQEWSKLYSPPTPNTPEGIPITLAFLPMYHTYGLHLFVIRAFMTQNTLVILPKWDIELALDVISKYRITSFPLVPSVVDQVVNHVKAHKGDISSITNIGCGAAHLSVQLAERLTSLSPKLALFTQGYGMSEVTIAAATTPYPGILNGRAKPNPGSVGILLPGMEARIVREDGSEASVNEPGELFLKGGNVALGYRKNRRANEETFIDGWLRTGDRFRVDEDGNFFYNDRTKDILKVSGMQVSPVEIEGVLLLQPDKLIVDVTVAGVSGGRMPDEKVPRAWIVLSEAGKQQGAAEVVNRLDGWCRTNLSKYKWLRGGIEVVAEIPKSPTGKVLRRVLQERYEEKIREPRGRL